MNNRFVDFDQNVEQYLKVLNYLNTKIYIIYHKQTCRALLMDMQQRKYLANDIIPNPSILKEISTAAKRKQLTNYFDKQASLIIDYGSQTIKAGYDLSNGPQLIFRPYVSKNRDPSRQQQPTKISINTSYDQLSFIKQNYKSLYQRNIILHFSILEQCNDYIFSQLAKPMKKIRSNLIITEPFGNPIHCRQSIIEQIFECYEIQNVMVGVDSLFKYFYEVDCNMDRYEKQSALVIDLGANTTHVFCIDGGKVDCKSVRRINLGGNQSFDIFSKSVLLKNPQLKTKLTYHFVRDLYERFSSVAIDYKQQLRYFSKKYQVINNQIYLNRIHELNKDIKQDLNFIQGVQIDFDTIIQIPQEEIKRKQQIKQRMAQKLKQTIQRRKEMKKKLHQHQLNTYKQLCRKYQQHDPSAHQEAVQMFGHHKPHQKLIKKIKGLQIKLGLVEQKNQQKKFSLIDIPDHQLPPDKLKFKRMQIYQRKAMEERRQKQLKKLQQQQKMKQLRENNPELYLQQLKQKFKLLSEKAKEHQRMKSQMANRKSKYNKKKMQVIARLAQQQFNQQEFMQQQQAQQIRQIQLQDHFSQLDVMQAQLRQIDPQYTHHNKDQHRLYKTNQLFLLTDLIRCNQIYFEPQLIGLNQMDLIQSIVSMISPYENKVKAQLLKNVVVVGGASKVPGFKQRIERDLRRQCPLQMEIKVRISKGGYQGAFLAMQNISKTQKQFIQKMSFKRSDYLENQKIQFIQNPWSNPKSNIN